ncbi:MAG TPA: hydantoinase/oxoprolinase family protein, partial [Polyangiaceae bacterium]|nr:hydantoinase/oxoprolinase family protein [Polyangiaceae bacterium]
MRSSDQAPIVGIRALLRINDAAPIPPCDVRLGTTVATNALLERKGAAVGLLVTQGFEDLLLIGTQARPELFELDIQKPKPLYSAVEGVRERMDARGDVLRELDEAQVLETLKRWRDAGLSSIAVCLLHSVKSPKHELRIGALARSLGFDHVALSHEVSNEVGFLARCDTCVLDATLTPLCRAHLRNLRAALSQDSSVLVMQSSGGLTTPEQLRGPRAVLSGPAAGVVALSRLAKSAQLGPCLGFDMGGTSTDVSRYAGDLETDFETEVAGIAIRAPMLRIETVAAGGGSLCWVDAGRLRVGPQSAGATPGPLCYGAPEADALTVTDVNLLLGRLVPDRFPLPLNAARAEGWLTQARPSLQSAGSIYDLAEGFFHVANANMAEAVRRVSALRGHDPRDHSLVVFGGSGGQHACALARRLGIKRVVFHPWAGVLSAYGLGLAELSAHAESDATGTQWTEAT